MVDRKINLVKTRDLRKTISIILVLALVAGCFVTVFTPTVSAATSLVNLKTGVPSSAVEFIAGGISGNGLNGPNTIWWDYDSVAKSGDVYLLVASANAGKIANGAMLGTTVGLRIDSLAKDVDPAAPKGTAYTLIKFTGVWLNGDEILQVDMGNGYGTGQEIKGAVNDYFPQLKNIRYYDDETLLGLDTQLSGTTVTVWGIDDLPGVPTGHKFLGWAYEKKAEQPSVAARSLLKIDGDIDLYAVWAKDTFSYTVEYYYNNVKDNDATETGSAEFESTITNYISKPQTGYKFDYATTPLIISADPTDNVIYVYYMIDESQRYTITYVAGTGGNVDPTSENHQVLYTGANTGSTATATTGYKFTSWTNAAGVVVGTDAKYVPTVHETATFTANFERVYTVKFLPGAHGDFSEKVYPDLLSGSAMPAPPHPYAQFSYKFTGWLSNVLGDDGKYIFYSAPDYTNPTNVPDFPTTVTGDVTFTAQWKEVDPSMTFPDKIPSVEHFDRWWGNNGVPTYGVICFAASTTKDDMYTIMFADWFFDVYKSVTIGYGTPGKMSYEITFAEDGITLWQITGNGAKEVKNKDIKYAYDMECIRDGHYFTKDKSHNYGYDFGMNEGMPKGYMQGVTFANPFGNGAKLAWLY
jgi:hypothetical protein